MKGYIADYKSLTLLGLPIAVGQLGIIILSFADTFMIGSHDAFELGAAAFDNSLFNLCILFGTGFSYGLVPVSGGFFGKGERQKSGQSLRVSILANLLLAALLMLVMAVFYLNIDLMGQPADLLPLIKSYYLILLSTLPFVMLFNAFKQFTDSITQTHVAMWILLGGNALNILGNYVLIFGHFGFPELGLVGAGYSTLFSRILMVLVYTCLFAFHPKYAVYRQGFWMKQDTAMLFKQLNLLGWPVGLQMGMETASFSLTAIMVGWLGALQLASHQVMLTISQFTFMIYYGLGAAVAVRVSNFVGTKDIRNVKRTVNAGFHLMILLEVVLTGILLLFYQDIGGWFTSGNPEVTAMVASLFVPFVIYQFGDGLQITFSNALRGIADVKPVIMFAFIAYFVISLPLCYVFAIVLDWGLVGVWMSFPFGLTSAGLMFWLRYRHTINHKKCD